MPNTILNTLHVLTPLILTTSVLQMKKLVTGRAKIHTKTFKFFPFSVNPDKLRSHLLKRIIINICREIQRSGHHLTIQLGLIDNWNLPIQDTTVALEVWQEVGIMNTSNKSSSQDLISVSPTSNITVLCWCNDHHYQFTLPVSTAPVSTLYCHNQSFSIFSLPHHQIRERIWWAKPVIISLSPLLGEILMLDYLIANWKIHYICSQGGMVS